jgi:nucleoside-diphosphate-sugar epimerase
MTKKIFITGGAGYVGSMLSKNFLDRGYEVTIFDLFLYGENVIANQKNLKKIKGDIRDKKLLSKVISGHEVVIHLACISNDPSFELNPELGKSINFDCFEPLVKISKDSGVKKFVYASSSSVYGLKKVSNVNEEMSLEPLTDYSKFKAMCEDILLKYSSKNFVGVILRPATVCGYSTRQRFDLVVNILCNLAFNKGIITVFGGEQFRPNINIKDMIEAYHICLVSEDNKINGKIFNVGFENYKVLELANMVKKNFTKNIELKISKTDDNRSYHISSEKIKNELNFMPNFTIEEAIVDLIHHFEGNNFKNSLSNEMYFNIKRMQSIGLS